MLKSELIGERASELTEEIKQTIESRYSDIWVDEEQIVKIVERYMLQLIIDL